MLIHFPDLLDEATLSEVTAALADADWVDGKSSAHGSAREVKNNQVVPVDHPVSKAAGQKLLARLGAHDAFRAAALPRTVMPFQFCRYDPGMQYGDHLDLPLMGTASGAVRTDLSMTLFLSAPDSYKGGSLVFESGYGRHVVRGAAGEAVLYPSSTLHRVEPVSEGRRLVAITWMQSMVRDVTQRQILFKLAQSATQLEAKGDPLAADIRHAQYNLLRMWAE